MSYVLVVIDMQEDFLAATKRPTIEAVAGFINKAIKDDAFVLFVEYENCSPTYSELTSLCKGYNHKIISKFWDDGSKEIDLALIDLGLTTFPLRLVGVNTNACVLATALGMYHLGYCDLTLLIRGCNSEMELSGYRTVHESVNYFLNYLPAAKVDWSFA